MPLYNLLGTFSGFALDGRDAWRENLRQSERKSAAKTIARSILLWYTTAIEKNMRGTIWEKSLPL